MASHYKSFILLKQNFRVLKFGLKQCKVGVAKNVAEALFKFAFPSQHTLMFSYNYRFDMANDALRKQCN